jgi:hypothetical protein
MIELNAMEGLRIRSSAMLTRVADCFLVKPDVVYHIHIIFVSFDSHTHRQWHSIHVNQSISEDAVVFIQNIRAGEAARRRCDPVSSTECP